MPLLRPCTALALLVFLAARPCSAQETVELIALKWADPVVLGALLNDEPPPAPEELQSYRQQWVNDFAGRVAASLPADLSALQPRWHYASTIVSAPREQVREPSLQRGGRLLPEGIVPPIVVIREQNALLVKGTPAAIDQLRELIAMLDVKPRMVNIEVRLVDNPVESGNEWGMDFATQVGDLLIATVGNLPPAGLIASTRRRNTQVAVGWDQTAGAGNVLTAANITTTNNVPAIITFGRMMPFVTTQVSYGPWGQRVVSTQVDAIFIGTELFVQPRINRDDSVTMRLRPTFIEAVGSVVSPHGVVLPITETVGTETVVTVPDGETLQIGGFERSLQEYNTRFSGIPFARARRIESHPALFVTPRIVREVEQVMP